MSEREEYMLRRDLLADFFAGMSDACKPKRYRTGEVGTAIKAYRAGFLAGCAIRDDLLKGHAPGLTPGEVIDTQLLEGEVWPENL